MFILKSVETAAPVELSDPQLAISAKIAPVSTKVPAHRRVASNFLAVTVELLPFLGGVFAGISLGLFALMG